MLVLLLLQGCSPVRTRYTHTFLGTFDTVVQVIGYADSRADFERAAQTLETRMTELHRLFDIYNTYDNLNNLKTVNDCAGICPVVVDKAVLDLVSLVLDQPSDVVDVVNIALGPVLSLWHRYREAGVSVPPPDALEQAATLSDASDVIIDRAASTLFLRRPSMSLDVGACAKGYAVALVCAELPDGYLVSAGGNVLARGRPDDRDAWTVGIQDPLRPESADPLLTLRVADGAVVTSGDYQRYYEVDGRRYCHIIDPATLFPAANFCSVSVIGPDSALCDLLSTALFVLPYEDGLKLAQSRGCDAIWVSPSGEINMTDGARDMLQP